MVSQLELNFILLISNVGVPRPGWQESLSYAVSQKLKLLSV